MLTCVRTRTYICVCTGCRHTVTHLHVPSCSQGVSQLPSTAAAPSPNVQQQLITLLQTLVVQQQQRKQQQQQQQLQQQQQQETMQENNQQQALQHVQDLSSAITRKAEEILQMQSSLPQNTAINLSNNPAVPSTLSPSPSSTPVTTSVPVCTTVSVPILSAEDSVPTSVPHIREGDIQSAILNNLFAHNTSGPGSVNSARLFQTSSDTVDQLLRGLNTKTQSESIQKLSRDTASVLPTFARVLESSIGSRSLSPPGTVWSDGDGAGGAVRGVEEGEGKGDGGLGERELSPASVTGMKYTCACTCIIM